MKRRLTRRVGTSLVFGLAFTSGVGVVRASAGGVIHVDTTTQGVTNGLGSLQEVIYSAEFGNNIAVDQTDRDTSDTTGCEAGIGGENTVVLPGADVSFSAFR